MKYPKWLKHFRPPTQAELRAECPMPPTSYKRILFLDDDENMCSLMAEWCQPFQVELVLTRTVREAKEQFHAKPTDALILDVKLSNGKGVELYADVAQTHPNTHVVFLTAYDSHDVKDEIEKIGPARVHSKTNAMNRPFIEGLFAQWGVLRYPTDCMHI